MRSKNLVLDGLVTGIFRAFIGYCFTVFLNCFYYIGPPEMGAIIISALWVGADCIKLMIMTRD